MDVEQFLAHHGVRGMRWGVRRRSTSGGSTKSGKKTSSSEKISDDAKRAKATQAKAKVSTDLVSNQDLQHLVTRMNLEKQYSSLSTQTSQSRIKTGQSIGRKILSSVKVTDDIVRVANSPSAKLGRKLITQAATKKAASAASKHALSVARTLS